MAQAEDYCKQQNKFPGVVSENTTYEGSMSESDFQTIKTTANVAQSVGGAAFVFGGQKEKQAGGLVGMMGVAGNAAIVDNGYKTEIQFKCQ